MNCYILHTLTWVSCLSEKHLRHGYCGGGGKKKPASAGFYICYEQRTKKDVPLARVIRALMVSLRNAPLVTTGSAAFMPSFCIALIIAWAQSSETNQRDPSNWC